MKNKITNTLHRVATGEISVDQGTEQIEKLFEDNQIGQQFSIFDEEVRAFNPPLGMEAQRMIVEVDNHFKDALVYTAKNSGVRDFCEELKGYVWNPRKDSPPPINFNKPFDGSDIIPEFDQARLTGQLEKIYDLMIDGKFRTLSEVESITGFGQASISAQLRNLRKKRYGSHTVDRQRRGERSAGLFEYKLHKQ